MHVQNIELVNFKTIKEFKQDFTGGIYLIKGENEVGKTTLLSAIITLLTGERSDNLLTHGAEKGFAKMKVGDESKSYEIELKFSEANPRGVLTIAQSGSLLKSDNKTVLQQLLQYQDFDANEFVRWSETAEGRRKQIKLVKSLFSADTQKQIEDIETTVRLLKDEQTGTNAEIKVFDTFCSNSKITTAEIEKYKKHIDENILINKKTDAARLQAQIVSIKNDLKKHQEFLTTVEGKTNQIDSKHQSSLTQIQEEEERLKRDYEAAMERCASKRTEADQTFKNDSVVLGELVVTSEDEIKRIDTWLIANPDPELDKIQKEIEDVTLHNQNHLKVKEHQSKFELLQAKVKEKNDRAENIKKLEKEKEDLINNSALPIPGLSFNEERLTLNGVPFEKYEISTSQEMEVAVKILIAKNPTVKVLKIAQGESLGANKLKAIVDFASENGFQGFIENVVRGQAELKVEEYREFIPEPKEEKAPVDLFNDKV